LAAGWPVYGGDHGGRRYSPLDELTPHNVHRLERAWHYRTGDLPGDLGRRNHSFEATPILHEGALYLCTPRSRVVALDARSGVLRWQFDPEVDLDLGHYNLNCRGVAHWRDERAPAGAACRDRIFVATADARLVAVDARTGTRCAGFGEAGEVAFWRGIALQERAEYGISSPPVLVRDVVVLGSAVGENRRTDMPSGKVHAFDARTGAARWTWDPIPKDSRDPAFATWEDGSALRTGAANVWSIPSADPERDLVFVPTSSPSPDFYGGERLGDNRYADSVVALRGSTGELVWHFQTVHHDLWDYDVASQPVLIDFPLADGRQVPAVAQATKMGHLFFLDRESGEPLVPVEERPVPPSTVPGERAAPTQPFPSWPPSLAPQAVDAETVFGFTPWDRARCRERLAAMRNEGVFTPPSFEGSLLYPGTAGGSNWGSVAYDPERRLLVANTSNVAQTLQLAARDQLDEALRARRGSYAGVARMLGTPYVAVSGVFTSPLGAPCIRPPWGALTALDLASRARAWRRPLGTIRELAPVPIALEFGTPNQGGPIVTAGGLVFVAAAMDDALRAFDLETGALLWSERLPAGAQATPMTYRARPGGRQYVVIAAGGHSQLGTTRGDHVLAFALPNADAGEVR
jgi:quinoprotein glucose dehydrogenase